MGFVSFNDEAEQYLCAAVLRPGNVEQRWEQSPCCGVLGEDDSWPVFLEYGFRVCWDGGFAHPAVLEFLDAQPKLEYVVAMAKNAVVKRVAIKRNATSAPVRGAAEKPNIFTGKAGGPQGREVATPAPRHHQSRGFWCGRQGPQTESSFCHHQHGTEPAVDL